LKNGLPQFRHAGDSLQSDLISRYADDLQRRKFWGKVELSFEDGKLVGTRETVTRKTAELIEHLAKSEPKG
jgi:hypothetical protein